MFSHFYRFCYQHKYIVGTIVTFFVVSLFGDTLIHFIGHLLHLVLEFVESILEHLLEALFGLTPRQAQIVLFYSFVIVMSYVSWQLARKTYFALLSLYAEAKLYWRELKKSRRFKAILMLGALGTTVYLFS
jgi:hypothetical protein